MTVTDTVEGTRGTASGSATATPKRRAPARRAPRVESFPVQLHADLDAFAPCTSTEGPRRGAEATLALLRELKPRVGTDRHLGAYIRLRDFIAHAGAAACAVREGPPHSAPSREWAARQALGLVVSVALLGLEQLDLERLAHDEIARLDRDEAFWRRHQAQEKSAFVQRMAQGRRRAAAQRVAGGAA